MIRITNRNRVRLGILFLLAVIVITFIQCQGTTQSEVNSLREENVALKEKIAQLESEKNILQEELKSLREKTETQAVSKQKPELPKPIIENIKEKPTLSQDKVIVYITKTGKKYHSAGCRYLSKSCIPIELSEAKARGCTPCSRCSPPR